MRNISIWLSVQQRRKKISCNKNQEMQSWQRSRGQFAATLTPFHSDGSLNLDIVDAYIDHLIANDVSQIFLNGTAGEHASLTVDERKQLLEMYLRNGKIKRLIVHIGGNNLTESIELAKHAENVGAECIACVMPAYYKASNLDAVIEYCRQVAAVAPKTPFMYYHISVVTGIKYSCYQILTCARRQIPTLVGAKFTSTDLVDMTKCLSTGLDILIGAEAIMVGAWAMGCRAVIGGSLSIVGKCMHRLLGHLEAGDHQYAMIEQVLIQKMMEAAMPTDNISDFIASFKYVMRENSCGFGIDFGQPRLPIRPIEQQYKANINAAVKLARQI